MVIAMLIFFIAVYESEMTYMALYSVLVLPVISLVFTLISKRRFSVEENLSENSVVKGEQVLYTFRVKNNSFLPCVNVRIRFKANSAAIETDFKDKYFHIMPFKSHESIFNVGAKYRGIYEIGVANILLFDFLGLFKFEQSHGKILELIVLPRVRHLEGLPLSTASQGLETAKRITQEEDYSVISDLRKYQPTDGYKKIHWKVSAKRNELISKNYQALKRNTAALILDNSLVRGRENGSTHAMEDTIMESYVSVLAHCSRLQFLTSLEFMGAEQEAIGGFEYLYSVASQIKFGRHGNFDDFIINYQKMQIDVENLVIFSQNISDTIFACVQSLLLFGNNVILYYFNELTENQKRRVQQLKEIGAHCMNFKDVVAV